MVPRANFVVRGTYIWLYVIQCRAGELDGIYRARLVHKARALNLFYNGGSVADVRRPTKEGTRKCKEKERGKRSWKEREREREGGRERESASRVGGKQIRRQKRKNRLDSSLLAHSRLSTAISASLVSHPGRFFTFSPDAKNWPRRALDTILALPLPRPLPLHFSRARGPSSSSVP